MNFSISHLFSGQRFDSIAKDFVLKLLGCEDTETALRLIYVRDNLELLLGGEGERVPHTGGQLSFLLNHQCKVANEGRTRDDERCLEVPRRSLVVAVGVALIAD